MRIEIRKVVIAAGLAALAAAAAAVYAYRRELVEIAAWILVGRLGWLYLRHRVIGLPHRRGWIAGAAAAAAGYLIGRRTSGETHPCSQCGHPIAAPSRAQYCGPACRRYAGLERREIERKAAALEAFGDLPDGF